MFENAALILASVFCIGGILIGVLALAILVGTLREEKKLVRVVQDAEETLRRETAKRYNFPK